jgi:hypothetical protein
MLEATDRERHLVILGPGEKLGASVAHSQPVHRAVAGAQIDTLLVASVHADEAAGFGASDLDAQHPIVNG